MERGQVLVYGFGHVLNDIGSANWFAYLVVFLTKVQQLPGTAIASIIFFGQLTDGLVTPLLGYWSDRFHSPHFGRRKIFIFVGSLLVVTSFGSLMGTCTMCNLFGHDNKTRVIVYAICGILYNVGWAAVQVAHLALVPELTSNDDDRVLLNSVRHMFTILSSVFVNVVAWIVLSDSHINNLLGPQDLPAFDTLVTVSLAVGAVSVIAFLLFLKNPPETAPSDSPRLEPSWRSWLVNSNFYKVGAVYTFARVYINTSMMYLPEYLLDSLGMEKTVIAKTPLIVCFTSILTTFAMRKLNQRFGRRGLFILGNTISLLAFIAFGLLATSPSLYVLVFPVCGVLGVGSAIALVTAVTMQADLLGSEIHNAAFVYGMLSLGDKILNGVAIAVVELLRPDCQANDSDCGLAAYFVHVMSIFCSLSALVALWFVLSIPESLFKIPSVVAKTTKTDETDKLIN